MFKACEVVRCKFCREEKAAKHFDRNSVEHHFKHGREVVCQSCIEIGRSNYDSRLYCCTGPCKGKFGHRKFLQKAVENYNQRGETTMLICSSCQDEKKHLTALAKQGKRVCTCGKPIHQQTCKLAPKYSGERPYPWCDVMSRPESDWLTAAMSKQGRA